MFTQKRSNQVVAQNCTAGFAYRRQVSVLALVLLAAAALALGTSTAIGQTISSATLRGEVKDPNGAGVPKANVTLISTQRGDERKVATNDSQG
jgi:hypothetical protein